MKELVETNLINKEGAKELVRLATKIKEAILKGDRFEKEDTTEELKKFVFRIDKYFNTLSTDGRAKAMTIRRFLKDNFNIDINMS